MIASMCRDTQRAIFFHYERLFIPNPTNNDYLLIYGILFNYAYFFRLLRSYVYLFFVYHQIIYYINFHLDTNEGRRLGLFSGLMLCSPPLFEQKISLKLPRRRLHLDLLGSCRVFELCLFDNKDKPPLQRLLRRKPPNKSSGDKKLMARQQQW